MQRFCFQLKDMSAFIAIFTILILTVIFTTWHVARSHYENQEKIRPRWQGPLTVLLTTVAITLGHKAYVKIKREMDQRHSWGKAQIHKSWSIKERITTLRQI